MFKIIPGSPVTYGDKDLSHNVTLNWKKELQGNPQPPFSLIVGNQTINRFEHGNYLLDLILQNFFALSPSIYF